MAITINGVTYRNLQEQVEKNKEDIKTINTALDSLKYMHNIHVDDGTADWYFNVPSSRSTEVTSEDLVELLYNVYGTNIICSVYGNVYDSQDEKIYEVKVNTTINGVGGYYDSNGTTSSISLDFENITTFKDDVKTI